MRYSCSAASRAPRVRRCNSARRSAAGALRSRMSWASRRQALMTTSPRPGRLRLKGVDALGPSGGDPEVAVRAGQQPLAYGCHHCDGRAQRHHSHLLSGDVVRRGAQQQGLRLRYVLGVQSPVSFSDPVGFVLDGDVEAFRRCRPVDLKHGRISWMARMGYRSRRSLASSLATCPHPRG